jgi:hypothetical protein
VIGLVWAANHHLAATGDCWTSFLLYTAVGFVIGIVAMGIPYSGYHSQYGFDFNLTILGGRAFSPRHKPDPLPLLPKAILIALLSSGIPLVLSHEECPGFLDHHLFFFLVWLTCGASIAAWLIKASELQRRAEMARTDQIEEFLSDSSSPVPHTTEQPLRSMILWHYSNLVLFAVVMLIAVFSIRAGI